MNAKTTRSTTVDTYAKLVKKFRLSRIKNDGTLQEAHDMIERLLQEDLDASGQDYLDVLVDLVDAYEDHRFPMAEVSDVDVLRELMRSNGLSQNGLAKRRWESISQPCRMS